MDSWTGIALTETTTTREDSTFTAKRPILLNISLRENESSLGDKMIGLIEVGGKGMKGDSTGKFLSGYILVLSSRRYCSSNREIRPPTPGTRRRQGTTPTSAIEATPRSPVSPTHRGPQRLPPGLSRVGSYVVRQTLELHRDSSIFHFLPQSSPSPSTIRFIFRPTFLRQTSSPHFLYISEVALYFSTPSSTIKRRVYGFPHIFNINL